MFFLLILIPVYSFVSSQDDSLCKAIETIAAGEMNDFTRNTRQQRSYASSNFSVSYYRCEWEIDPAVRFIKGKVTSYFRVNTPSNSVSFDFTSQLTVDSIIYHTAKIGFVQNPEELQVNFPASIGNSQQDSISIFYHGEPSSSGYGSFVKSTHNGVPVIWTLSEPYGARDWWPCRNGLDDKADSIDIIIICPVAYRASSNGLLVSETDNGINRTAFYKHRYPIASYLVAFAVTNYTVLNHVVQLGNVNLPMITYCYPENESSFQQNTSRVLQALSLFHRYFGDYPFINERYGHTQFAGGGMEHQTNSFIGSANENLMAHELAHQWFGDKVTCGSWQDIWLNEGFATYLSYFYFENSDPAGHLNRIKNLRDGITSNPNGSVWVNDTLNISRLFNARLTYNKGAYLVHMLRWVLGDTIFFKGIQQYLKDSRVSYHFARTADLQRNLEQVSGRDLAEFFQVWFYGEGHPSYTVHWWQNSNHWAKITLSQVSSNPSVSYFEMPVTLLFKSGTQQKTVVVNNTKNNENFWVDVGFNADTVIIDPEYKILSRDNISIKETPVSTLANDLRIFPVPVINNLTLSLKNPSEKVLQLRILNAMGQLISSRRIDTPGGDLEFEINFSLLARGVYLLCFDAGDFHAVRRIVK